MKKSIPSLILALSLLLSAAPALASGVFIESENSAVSPGQSFQTDLFLGAGGKNINAIEGKIIFPSETLKLVRTAEGKSAVSLWVEKPELESEDQIVFSGGLPGGFSGEKGLLFSIIFRVREGAAVGSGRITAEDLKAYLDDGRGTPVNVSFSPFNFVVAKKESAATPELEETKDANPPEPFVPYVGRNPTVYDNQWFVAFSARDGETGIDYYEIWENDKKYDINDIGNVEKAEWTKAENPRLLKDQNLESYVYVKAVDKAGNERVEIIPPSKSGFVNYKSAIIVIIIIALLFLVLLFVRKVSATFKKRA